LLDVVVGNFLDSVTEREFDPALLALLRSQGFDDVHLIHGQFEFGKDAIAKGGEPRSQHSIQSKAGNIGLADWTAMRGQLDMLRLNELAHPSFDRAMPRVGLLVLTGRLVGGAPLDAQEYQRSAAERDEPPLEIWDRERVIELMASSPEAALAGVTEGPLLELIGRIDGERVAEADLEVFSRRWITEGAPLGWGSLLEATIVANRLRTADRLDLACFTALALLRGLWASSHALEPAPDRVTEQAALVRQMFMGYAGELWTGCTQERLDPRNLIGADAEGIFVTYPVRVCRMAELVGLYGLGLSDNDDREEVSTWLAQFLDSQPGITRPLSDRWAVSLLPPLLLVGRGGSATRQAVLRGVVRWLGDRYGSAGLGLAASDATPEVEVEYVLGGSLEHVSRERLATSYLAAVVLDLAATFELPDVYDVAFNDIEAVGICPAVPIPNDDAGQYLISGPVPVETAPKYAEYRSEGSGWRMAPHHDEDVNRYYLGRLGVLWDHLAVSLVTRDRHWVAGLRALAQR
jgi:hypothetical protein